MGRESKLVFLIVFLSASLRVLCAQGGKSGDQEARFRVESFSSLYEVRVTDAGGAVVRGLSAHHFHVFEDGRERKIRYFQESPDTAVSVGILVDIGSGMNRRQIRLAKEAVFELIHLLDPNDEVLLAVYERDVHFLSPLTRDRLELVRAIDDISSGGRPSFWSRLGSVFASTGHTGSAIDETLLKLKASSNRSKVVLVLSSAAASLGVATTEHLRLSGARLFIVTWQHRLGDAFNLWGDRTAGNNVIRGSGGIAFPGKEILERIDQLRDAMKCFYLVAFDSAVEKEDEKEPELEFRVSGPTEYRAHWARRVASSSSLY